MKKLRTIIPILFLSFILSGMTSCLVTRHAENEEHRGWFHRHNDHREKRGAVLIITPENRHDRDRNRNRHDDRD